jgi:hypothetical protein
MGHILKGMAHDNGLPHYSATLYPQQRYALSAGHRWRAENSTTAIFIETRCEFRMEYAGGLSASRSQPTGSYAVVTKECVIE